MKPKPRNNIQLDKMRKAGRLAAELLDYLTPHVKPGISTLELNDMAEAWTQEHGATSAPLNYRGFPKSICTSINDVICHGIPCKEDVLKDGDIINIDVTLIVDGWYGDTSRMFPVGNISADDKKLIQTTYDCMMAGIETVRSGSDIADIGKAIQPIAQSRGFSVVRDFVGHGIGDTFHSDPMIIHYDAKDPRYKMKLRKGVTFTIEPMINAGTWQSQIMEDDWTAKTIDGKKSAQFEHTIAVTEDGVEILTASPAGYTCPPYK